MIPNPAAYMAGYGLLSPPRRTLRVWGSSRGQKPALFEVSGGSHAAAIREVRQAGYERALVEVK